MEFIELLCISLLRICSLSHIPPYKLLAEQAISCYPCLPCSAAFESEMVAEFHTNNMSCLCNLAAFSM